MSDELAVRVSQLGGRLATRMPDVLAAAIGLLESMSGALEAARPERYEIERRIGAGGQAEVLLAALHGAAGFQRPLAIKRVRADLADPDRGTYAAMLTEEALLAAELSHPNIISVFDFDRDQVGLPFLVMEYIDGIDLAKLIQTGPVPHPAVIFIMSELLSGLGYLHELRARGVGRVRGLVHRDVTPHNVLLSWEGAVKLADLGVARTLQGPMTAASLVPVGKVGYMSPEQASGDELDCRSDLYAVGILLWELLAGRRLRVGPAAGRLAVEVDFHAIPRPSEYRQNVPADLAAVAMRLLAVRREDRYSTAELAAHDLMRCQAASRDGRGELVRLLAERLPLAERSPRPRRQRSISRPPAPGLPSDRPITVSAPSAPPGTPPAPAPAPQEPGNGHRRAGPLQRARRWWRPLAIGVLLALALAVAAALLLAR